jgi:RNA polymerase sigma factor (sigma-70 family)
MTTPVLTESLPNADLWQLVRQGSVPAFEVFVRRHQSLVCAVAYNTCGDFALSEDVAQETFWAAWRERASPAQPRHLQAWLCGIARNLGRNARRRASRAADTATPLDVVTDLSTDEPGPAEAAVSREEEALVWQTLRQIPGQYREPLILFYREHQSVAEVAAALDLSEDTVKQRLSRGRAMLRERVAGLVEGTLRRTRPGRVFTVAVMTGLTTLSAGAKTALAGAGAGGVSSAVAGSTLTAAGTGITGGVLGGVLGSLGGLLGGWLGYWLPAQLAPTRPERDYILRTGWRMLVVSVLFAALLIGPALAFAGRVPFAYYMIFWATWMVAYGAYVTVESVRAARAVKRLRAETAAEPNDTPLRRSLTTLTARFRGRVYRSRATLFGLPLIDIHVSDPLPPGGTGLHASGERRVARGWIAIGDDACGLLLAVGEKACGFIAIGGRTVGVLSCGGIAVGVVAVGGVALGVLGIGGFAAGVYAVGGGALAWEVACGGGAVAWQAAFGGGAIAGEYAVGGGAWARHANDETAKALLLNHPLVQNWAWSIDQAGWCAAGIVLLSLLVVGALLPLMYRREAAR